ncbi:MAG: sulfatase, partial [Verrucomicrobiota bacterium]
ADPTRTSAFAGIAAMNVIDELGERARPLLGFVRGMEVRDPNTPARNNDYVQRLKGIVLERFGEEPAPTGRKKRN